MFIIVFKIDFKMFIKRRFRVILFVQWTTDYPAQLQPVSALIGHMFVDVKTIGLTNVDLSSEVCDTLRTENLYSITCL